MNARLLSLREEAKKGRDPACADETFAFILTLAERVGAENILEIGAAEGLTSIALLLSGAERATAIEKDPARAEKARENAAMFGVQSRLTLLEGDAAEILPLMGGQFDLIFLDGPKAQYQKYFPDCKRLLRTGGYLLSDDVLLFGWVRGEPPKKRRMLVEHIRAYLAMLQSDSDFTTCIEEFGEGLAVSQKIR